MADSRQPGTGLALPQNTGPLTLQAIKRSDIPGWFYRSNDRDPEWRARMQQASFKGVPFYVEQQGRASGRRIVEHQFPKRNVPYGEDMGRQAIRYQIQGYVIQGPGPDPTKRAEKGTVMSSTNPRMYIEYYINRDRLCAALDTEGPGILKDPYNPNLAHLGYSPTWHCERYTMTEQRERGGFASFEMSFIEAGVANEAALGEDSAYLVNKQAEAAQTLAVAQLNAMLAAIADLDKRSKSGDAATAA